MEEATCCGEEWQDNCGHIIVMSFLYFGARQKYWKLKGGAGPPLLIERGPKNGLSPGAES